MLKNRKSQAALEFLMTYGWAILVVLIVISALAYFGVLNPQRLLPARCTLPTGWSCDSYRVMASSDESADDGDIKINLLNGIGRGIYVTSITATPGSGAPASALPCSTDFAVAPAIGLLVNNGESEILEIDDCVVPNSMVGTDKKYRWNLAITYYEEGSTDEFEKTVGGEILTSVEAYVAP